MENGIKYVVTKEGLIKFIVIAFGCITFALLAESRIYLRSTALEWVLAAFIISFSLSLLFYFFRLTGLAARMQCGGPCSFDGFDFIWAWFSTIWCLAASITYASNFPDNAQGEAIASIIFAYLTTIAYGTEAFFLRLYAPANVGYVATKLGWIKTALVTFGAATFGLMADSGFNWCRVNDNSCEGGTTYAMVAFTVSWSVTTLMWLAHMAAPQERMTSPTFRKVEFVWAIIGALFFLTGASCFAAFMYCEGEDFDRYEFCQKRLSGVIAGFITGVIYVIEAFMVKRQIPST